MVAATTNLDTSGLIKRAAWRGLMPKVEIDDGEIYAASWDADANEMWTALALLRLRLTEAGMPVLASVEASQRNRESIVESLSRAFDGEDDEEPEDDTSNDEIALGDACDRIWRAVVTEVVCDFAMVTIGVVGEGEGRARSLQ